MTTRRTTSTNQLKTTSVFTVQHCNVAPTPPAFRPDMDAMAQRRVVSRHENARRASRPGKDRAHNSLHECKEAASVKSYEIAIKWSLLALVAEVEYYHHRRMKKDSSHPVKTTRRFSGKGDAPVGAEATFGSSALTDLIVEDTQMMFDYFKQQVIHDHKQQQIRGGAAGNTLDEVITRGVEGANQFCRGQFTQLYLWRPSNN